MKRCSYNGFSRNKQSKKKAQLKMHRDLETFCRVLQFVSVRAVTRTRSLMSFPKHITPSLSCHTPPCVQESSNWRNCSQQNFGYNVITELNLAHPRAVGELHISQEMRMLQNSQLSFPGKKKQKQNKNRVGDLINLFMLFKAKKKKKRPRRFLITQVLFQEKA